MTLIQEYKAIEERLRKESFKWTPDSAEHILRHDLTKAADLVRGAVVYLEWLESDGYVGHEEAHSI